MNLIVVDAIRNIDGTGMINITMPSEEAATYQRWSKWNGREPALKGGSQARGAILRGKGYKDVSKEAKR